MHVSISSIGSKPDSKNRDMRYLFTAVDNVDDIPSIMCSCEGRRLIDFTRVVKMYLIYVQVVSFNNPCYCCSDSSCKVDHRHGRK